MQDRLIFVYNANDGIVNAVIDAAHKLISPSTYECALCSITYGPLAMRSEWKAYLARLPYKSRFLYRDTFAREYPELETRLPAILLQRGAGLPVEIVDADTLEAQDDVGRLIAVLETALASHQL